MKNTKIILTFVVTSVLTVLSCGFAQAQNTETATGTDALANDPNSSDLNTADGYEALASDTSPGQNQNNTATGAYALEYENGFDNTGVGTQALVTNNNNDNTGVGYDALRNSGGSQNTAVGSQALGAILDHLPFGGAGVDTSGSNNTGVGYFALYNTTSGNSNTASGAYAMEGVINFQYGGPNTLSSGSYNTADGFAALQAYTSGSNNLADGSQALTADTTGSNNTALGVNALVANSTGQNNIAIGYNAAVHVTTGSFNIQIGNQGLPADTDTIRLGLEGKQTKTYVAGIFGATNASGVPVYVDASGRLGTLTSSAKFKKNIHAMGNVSDELLALRPVTFQYKPEIDPAGTPQFGLIAEEVEKVNPDLVVHDADHQIYTVRYEAVNAMLLNEFQKQHSHAEDQDKTIAEQQKTIANQQKHLEAQDRLLQSLAARLEQMEQAPATGR